MRTLFILIFTAGSAFAEAAPDAADLQALEAAHKADVKAWNERDIDAIIELEDGQLGFGRDTAFARKPRSKERYRKSLQGYFSMMEKMKLHVVDFEYRVIGDTGLAWGYYALTTKQKDGPMRISYGRETLTFVKTGGKWKIAFFHRSPIPTERTL